MYECFLFQYQLFYTEGQIQRKRSQNIFYRCSQLLRARKPFLRLIAGYYLNNSLDVHKYSNQLGFVFLIGGTFHRVALTAFI